MPGALWPVGSFLAEDCDKGSDGGRAVSPLPARLVYPADAFPMPPASANEPLASPTKMGSGILSLPSNSAQAGDQMEHWGVRSGV